MKQQEKRPKEGNPGTAQPKTTQSGETQGQDKRRSTTGQEPKTTTQTTGGSDPNKSGPGRG